MRKSTGVARDVRTAVRRRADAQTVPSTENNSSLPAQRHFLGTGLALIDDVDTRAAAAAAASLDHGPNRLLAADEERLDGTVAAIADPALQAALERRDFGPGAIADALHPARMT